MSGTDLAELKRLKENLPDGHPGIRVQPATLETIPGAIETLSILGVTIQIVSGIAAQVAAAWLYDWLKTKPAGAGMELRINGVKADPAEDLERLLKKKVKVPEKKAKNRS